MYEAMTLVWAIWLLHAATALGMVWVIRKSAGAELYLRLILAVGVCHGLLRTLWLVLAPEGMPEMGTPLVLLYGPLLYMAYRENIRRPVSPYRQYVHYVPFVVGLIWYLVALFFVDVQTVDSGKPKFGIQYVFAFFSFLAYPILLGYQKKYDRGSEVNGLLGVLIGQLSITYVFSAVVVALLLLDDQVPFISFDLDLRLLVFVLLVTGLLLVARYFYLLKRAAETVAVPANEKHVHKTEPVAATARYQKSALEEDLLSRYAETVHDCLQRSKLFLNSNLSLAMLSTETGIPKHHLSQVFNVHIHKSFYHLVAEYRIRYAIERMRANDGSITIESLAYECGFNSKTSFNQYFKEQTGYTPSDYRAASATVAVFR